MTGDELKQPNSEVMKWYHELLDNQPVKQLLACHREMLADTVSEIRYAQNKRAKKKRAFKRIDEWDEH